MLGDYSDQTDLFNPRAFTLPVHLIGLGGIGSAVVLPLVKLGLNTELHLWDDDTVDVPRIIAAQLLYRHTDIGRPKVEAAADIIGPYSESGLVVHTHQQRIDDSTDPSEFGGVVISGVDSMASRHAIWQKLLWNPGVELYMDGRIGGEETRLLCVAPSDPDQIDRYERWLPDDSQASELPCAARTVIHPPLILAGRIITQLTRYARGLPPAFMVYDHVRESQIDAN